MHQNLYQNSVLCKFVILCRSTYCKSFRLRVKNFRKVNGRLHPTEPSASVGFTLRHIKINYQKILNISQRLGFTHMNKASY